MKILAGLFSFVLAFALLPACGEEEAGVNGPSATAEPTPSPTLSTATLPPIPSDWPTYIDPGGLFSIRYPPTWVEVDGDFFSYDPATSPDGPSIDPESVKVEVNYYEAKRSEEHTSELQSPT